MPFNIDWRSIDDVLLDMDGTLLDLHYDATFWLNNVHSIVANLTGEPEHVIQERFHRELKKHEGTLAWYCTDYWADFFGIDLIEAKQQLAHLIRFRPHAEQFLNVLNSLPLRTLIATNAHPDVIQLKLNVVPLEDMVDGIVSSHQYGVAKEHPDFWRALFDEYAINPDRALFMDDSSKVLDAADRAGVREVVEIRHPNLSEPPRSTWKQGIDDFDVLFPGLEALGRS
ncbi:MAG TPA: haloacid dehalogenase [Gammaproteobacteria bacterium]|jgi:HAD superfamily hydrolase (TIGR01509 family)|nr:HAD-IA family hydrolase [Oceanospirillales bacterium]MCH1500795.1 HAD-IA family hydrolase [Litorivicinaceae bacterium]NBR74547.1 haloacid dehalogenase [Gammaproteobacteria bacterium]MDA8549171.1 HAD-IA family hydrolase [Litorivicinaceae bacterium]MDA8631350.1 HAD-IA family hydrolase [Litorivicinaceae bacterium]